MKWLNFVLAQKLAALKCFTQFKFQTVQQPADLTGKNQKIWIDCTRSDIPLEDDGTAMWPPIKNVKKKKNLNLLPLKHCI